MIDQNQYLENLEVDNINPAKVRHKNDDLDENKKTKIRKMAGSLNRIVRGTRPNKSLNLLMPVLSSKQEKLRTLSD